MANTPARTPAPNTQATDGMKPWIRGYPLGPWQTNTYLVADPGTKTCWVVDPSFGPAKVLEDIAKEGVKPVAIVLTHAHVDHIGGIADVLKAWPRLPIWIHRVEKDWLENPLLNLSDGAGMAITAPAPERLLQDGDVLELGQMRWKVLHTPGHTPGGVTLYNEDAQIAIVGDTLFAGSVGRTDLPGGDFETLETAIRSKLYTLPEETRCLPGHGPATTIGEEMANNPFVPG
jgi:hydroxyacylglutathione hydrolase